MCACNKKWNKHSNRAAAHLLGYLKPFIPDTALESEDDLSQSVPITDPEMEDVSPPA